jgi:hypothetical protein
METNTYRFDSMWFWHHLDPILCNDFSCRSKSTEKLILAVTDQFDKGVVLAVVVVVHPPNLGLIKEVFGRMSKPNLRLIKEDFGREGQPVNMPGGNQLKTNL